MYNIPGIPGMLYLVVEINKNGNLSFWETKVFYHNYDNTFYIILKPIGVYSGIGNLVKISFFKTHN